MPGASAWMKRGLLASLGVIGGLALAELLVRQLGVSSPPVDARGLHEYRPGAGLSSTKPDRTWQGRELVTEEIQIPTITLNELLDREGVTEVDFLSMDIEGGAPAALAGFDIERFKPELVCIERFGLGEDKQGHAQRILEYFAEHGYERIEKYDEYDRVNWYFGRTDSAL